MLILSWLIRKNNIILIVYCPLKCIQSFLSLLIYNAFYRVIYLYLWYILLFIYLFYKNKNFILQRKYVGTRYLYNKNRDTFIVCSVPGVCMYSQINSIFWLSPVIGYSYIAIPKTTLFCSISPSATTVCRPVYSGDEDIPHESFRSRHTSMRTHCLHRKTGGGWKDQQQITTVKKIIVNEIKKYIV